MDLCGSNYWVRWSSFFSSIEKAGVLMKLGSNLLLFLLVRRATTVSQGRPTPGDDHHSLSGRLGLGTLLLRRRSRLQNTETHQRASWKCATGLLWSSDASSLANLFLMRNNKFTSSLLATSFMFHLPFFFLYFLWILLTIGNIDKRLNVNTVLILGSA